jgi:hypothetical protein
MSLRGKGSFPLVHAGEADIMLPSAARGLRWISHLKKDGVMVVNLSGSPADGPDGKSRFPTASWKAPGRPTPGSRPSTPCGALRPARSRR